MSYNDYNFGIALEQPEDSAMICSWFGINSPFITICHRGEWRSDSDPSSRRTFFSAVITAISSLDIDNPVIFIPSTRMNIEKAIEIQGYRIKRIHIKDIPPVTYITHYESIIEKYYDRMSSLKHDLFYVDGAYAYFMDRCSHYCQILPNRLKSHFLKQIAAETASNEKNLQIQVVESYSCATNSVKFMAMYRYNESSFLARDQSFLLSILQSKWQYLRQVFKYQSLNRITSNTSQRSTMDSADQSKGGIFEDFEEEVYPSTSFDSRSSWALESIRKLDVCLSYRGSRLDYRVDNRNYTTMIPSKQPPSSWSCNVTFTYSSASSKPITEAQLQQQQYGHDYSTCLRYLFANYIISYGTNSGVSLGNLFSLRMKAKELINVDKIKALASSLSSSTKDLIDEVCNKILEAYKISISRDFHSSHPQGHQTITENNNKFLRTLFATAQSDPAALDDSNGRATSTNVNPSPFFDRSYAQSYAASVDMSSSYSSFDILSKHVPFLHNKRSASDLSSDIEQPALGWVTLLSIYCSTLSDGLWSISSLWNLCVRNLRESWEKNVAISHVKSYDPLYMQPDTIHRTMDSLLDTLNASDFKGNMLYNEPLWDDLLDELRRDPFWRDISLPNMELSLLNQKLQFLQFCTAVKDKLPYKLHANDPSKDKINLLRRLPLTEDSVNQYYRLTRKIRNKSTSYVISGRDESSKIASDSGDQSSIQHQFQYQVLAPSLVSDMRSFKAHNPKALFSDFCTWYDVNPTSSSASFMENIWKNTELCHAIDQKPLLRVETEAEKCLTYFETMPAKTLLLELVIASLPAMLSLISNELFTAIIDLLPSCANDIDLKDACEDVIRDLNAIHRDIETAIKELRSESLNQDSCNIPDVKSRNHAPSIASDVSVGSTDTIDMSSFQSIDQPSHILLDSIERKLYRMEEFLLRFRALTMLLTPPAIDAAGLPTNISVDFKDIKKLAMRLLKNGHVIAKSEAEAQILLTLSKNSMVPGSVASELASSQGRELSPLKKSITLSKSISPSYEMPSNDMSDGQDIRNICQRLSIEVTDDSIRASFALIDFDS